MLTQTFTPQILIVDDAREIREPLGRYLRKEGFRTRLAASAEEARGILSEAVIHLVVLDIMMPGEDGLSLAATLSRDRDVPILMLTARTEEDLVMAGFESGADDYVTKPFNPRELVARIRAILRRSPAVQAAPRSGRRRFEGRICDPAARTVELADGSVVELTTGESRLLAVLMDHPEEILSRERLVDLVWGRETRAYDRAIDNAISRLRRKIADAPRGGLIVTEWGGGYRLAATVEELP